MPFDRPAVTGSILIPEVVAITGTMNMGTLLEAMQPFDVFSGDLITTGWSYVQRVATRMCNNRALVGGFFNGTRDDSSYELVCVGQTGGFWRDATQAEINSTGWGFVDIDGVPRAQASRAAFGLCRKFDPQSPGGFMTGFMAKFPGDPEQKMGVVCFRGTSAELSETTADSLRDNDTLVGPGTLIGDLNLAPWASARRATTSRCRQFGFEAGISDGHQNGERRRVICVKGAA